MISLYWDIGRILVQRQQAEGWGAGVLRKLAQELKNELPAVNGFSERNLKRMTQFYREYPELNAIGPPPVAPTGDLLCQDKKKFSPSTRCAASPNRLGFQNTN